MEDYFAIEDFLLTDVPEGRVATMQDGTALPESSSAVTNDTITGPHLNQYFLDGVSPATQTIVSPRSIGMDSDSEEESSVSGQQYKESHLYPNGGASHVFNCKLPSESPFPISTASIKKKSLEEMDEDERLLASEEGKKLSSKERRQLRNKVSARHFRLRRKEYITHLEELIAQKSTESHSLKVENDNLRMENKRLAEALTSLTLGMTPGTTTGSSPAASFLSEESTDGDRANVKQHINLDQQHQVSDNNGVFESAGSHRIAPRIANLLSSTFNSRKDANPNAYDWPLAYGGENTTGPTQQSMSLGNMQVFNTLVPESLAEIEKDVTNGDNGVVTTNDNYDTTNGDDENASKTTVTLQVLSSKPDKEDKKPDNCADQEGIWEDARKAAEEVYQRLGLVLASINLDGEASSSDLKAAESKERLN
ncbi:hypothetical protein V1511DRAFT_460254 [Dipodascopsis uninucleata]